MAAIRRRQLVLLVVFAIGSVACTDSNQRTSSTTTAEKPTTTTTPRATASPTTTAPTWLTNPDFFFQDWPELRDPIRTGEPWSGELYGYLVLPPHARYWRLCRSANELGDCIQPLTIAKEPVIVATNPDEFLRVTDNPETTAVVPVISRSIIWLTGTFDPTTGTFTEIPDTE